MVKAIMDKDGKITVDRRKECGRRENNGRRVTDSVVKPDKRVKERRKYLRREEDINLQRAHARAQAEIELKAAKLQEGAKTTVLGVFTAFTIIGLVLSSAYHATFDDHLRFVYDAFGSFYVTGTALYMCFWRKKITGFFLFFAFLGMLFFLGGRFINLWPIINFLQTPFAIPKP